MNRSQALRGHAAMLLFSTLVAGSFSLGVRAANLIDPAAITVVRFIIAAGVLAGIAILMPRRGRPRALIEAPWRYLLLGGAFAGYFVLMFEGLKTAPAVAASAVFTLTPIMAAGFGWLLLRQRMTGHLALALALGGVGALWVIFRGDPAALMRMEIGCGEAIYFIGCALHALYAALVRKLSRNEGPLISSLGTLVAGGLLTAAWGWGALTSTAWGQLPAIVWITILYVAIFASAFTTLLVQYAAMRLPAAKVMAYTYLTPIWVILSEAALGQGLPGPVLLPGILAILGALALLLKSDEPAGGAVRAN
ncbi:DMT family transporter [Paracoccus sp. WLY502]|uniref:DMT family transporter n=1 Tax=Paracoccus yibinensis TaxID=3068891 RepID=UPI002796CD06|nr:DMT family transporter [Paracoccus sp. WLY502]MDQ1900619.1 DMT family transporter [Paracoccus sp. WLY502]